MDLNQGVDVSIKLKTEVTQAGEKKEFFFDLAGQVVKMGDTLYIRYKELQDDGEEIPVTLKVEPDGGIQLIRAGNELRMRLKFDYRKRLETSYKTPYGLFQIETYTHNLRFSLKDQPISGSVIIDYDLYSQTEKVGEYHLELEFTA